MKRMADTINGRDSKQSASSNNHSDNPRDFKRIRCVNETQETIGMTLITVKTLADEKETDSHRLAQRQKQIDYGKNTIGYDRYCAQVSKHQRRRGKHPMTPDKTMRIGKKGFDGIVRKWRQALHKYDPPELVEGTKAMISNEFIPVNAMTKTLDVDAIAVKSEEEATSIADCEGKNSILLESKIPSSSRSIYENFDEDDYDKDDSDDDLL
ncbi:hypothetical protein KXD40_007269 [Peronospora effusa]|nr:hypothetical protein KXD40_007269 [Peronospora effusa]CAI5728331.1 unnamed protein product [Peronospora effusa]